MFATGEKEEEEVVHPSSSSTAIRRKIRDLMRPESKVNLP